MKVVEVIELDADNLCRYSRSSSNPSGAVYLTSSAPTEQEANEKLKVLFDAWIERRGK